MLERQRILLDLIQRAKKAPSRTQLMKWLFLLKQETVIGNKDAFYDFLPYRFGPFSFVAYHEMGALAAEGYLDEENLCIPSQQQAGADDETGKLGSLVRGAIEKVLARYERLEYGDLISSVYERYPWYASKSELRPGEAVAPAAPAVYTMGYEGRSVDAFLDRLLKAGISRLIDVRNNAYSRKYGFTGKTLAKLCADVGIAYVHEPALGVPRHLREDIGDPAARERLFGIYEREILPANEEAAQRVAAMMKVEPSVLVCYEADEKMCHRGRLAPRIAGITGLPTKHL